MKVFKSKMCSDLDIQVLINKNDGLIKTIDIKQDNEVVIISQKSIALEFASYILKISEKLED